MPEMEIIIVGLLSKCNYIVIKAQISWDFKGGAKQYYVLIYRSWTGSDYCYIGEKNV